MIALTGTTVIETANLRLRAPQMSDFDTFAEFIASPRAEHVGGPITRVQAWRAFGHLIGHGVMRGYTAFIIADKDTDACLGASGPWFPEGWPEPEISWSIWSPEAEGRGLAHEAAVAARGFAYANLGWTTAISLISPANQRSQALAQRLGCVRDGSFTHEVFGDSHVWRHPSPEAMQ